MGNEKQKTCMCEGTGCAREKDFSTITKDPVPKGLKDVELPTTKRALEFLDQNEGMIAALFSERRRNGLNLFKECANHCNLTVEQKIQYGDFACRQCDGHLVSTRKLRQEILDQAVTTHYLRYLRGKDEKHRYDMSTKEKMLADGFTPEEVRLFPILRSRNVPTSWHAPIDADVVLAGFFGETPNPARLCNKIDKGGNKLRRQ